MNRKVKLYKMDGWADDKDEAAMLVPLICNNLKEALVNRGYLPLQEKAEIDFSVRHLKWRVYVGLWVVYLGKHRVRNRRLVKRVKQGFEEFQKGPGVFERDEREGT